MVIDTHCHLADPAFEPDRTEVLRRMRAAGVGRALVVESRLEQLDATLTWCEGEPDLGLATGCHPHDADAWDDALRARVQQAWRHPRVRAAGEMGLDYHYDHAPRDVQRRVFAEQLALAVAESLPVVIHAREADEDVATILREQPAARVVLHSFSSGPLLREAALEAGWYLSFSGMITFKSWHDLEVVRRVAIDRMLVETDAPYLAPVPHRGKRNEPAFVVEVARRVAELRGESVERIAAQTTANAEQLFWT
ncbi:MAG: TatD family hydrolase [Gemmatimonadota bacterium]